MPDASKTRLYSRVAESTKANYLAFQDRKKHAHIQSIVAKSIQRTHKEEPNTDYHDPDEGNHLPSSRLQSLIHGKTAGGSTSLDPKQKTELLHKKMRTISIGVHHVEMSEEQ